MALAARMTSLRTPSCSTSPPWSSPSLKWPDLNHRLRSETASKKPNSHFNLPFPTCAAHSHKTTRIHTFSSNPVYGQSMSPLSNFDLKDSYHNFVRPSFSR
ncbi:hypothetical protein M758_9G114800 [Ceratodon purpureus]|nr:hypothetical protein M758_9G114800 [Ceratodon purpureus]